jgi:alkylation response protein AidB-like acyl-CoA dehydrogenase
MDFEDTPEESAFRAEARAFLDQHAERRRPGVETYETESESDKVAKARRWQATKAQAGFSGITWPKAVGGRGAKPIHETIFRQEEKKYVVSRGVFEVSMSVCMPVVLACGREDQIERYVRPALEGKEIWCQLFSEPSAGSDLAGLRTRAKREGEGDEWIIDGQKTWTSGAHYADFGLLIARSDSTVAKHLGLTAFIVDMHTKGLEARPVKQMAGEVLAGFNDVFFTGMRVSDTLRIGAPGEGWKVTLTALASERYGISESPALMPGVEELHKLISTLSDAQGAPLIRNSAVREKLADLYVRTRGLKYNEYRTITTLSQGRALGPESSFTKLVHQNMAQEISLLALDLLGMHGMIAQADIAPMRGWFHDSMLATPTGRLAGGSDEIIRNIVAERVLGLPADVRVDKDLPFNKIKTGAR